MVDEAGLGGGLGDLLDAAKTGYESFYKDYIAIMGENGNKANINNSDIANNPEKIKQLEELSMKYAKDSKFREFEQDVAYERYFVKPVSQLPANVRDKVNGLNDDLKGIIMSTYVQQSKAQKIIINAFNNNDDPVKAVQQIVSSKGNFKGRQNLESKSLGNK